LAGLEASRVKRAHGECANAGIARRQCPRLGHEFGKLDSPPSRPKACCPKSLAWV
jgi:hypothetical protein